MVIKTIKKLVTNYYTNAVGRSAASVAYYLAFSFAPFIIFVSAFLGLLNFPAIDINTFSGLIPSEVISLINSYLEHISGLNNGSLLGIGLVLTIYSSMRAISSLTSAIETAFGKKFVQSHFLRRPFKMFCSSLLFMLAMIVMMILLIFGTTVLTFLSEFIRIGKPLIIIWNFLRFVIFGAIIFFLIYKLHSAAAGKRYSFRRLLPGVFGSFLSCIILSAAFSFYVENMSDYSALYGSLGAVIVLLMWLYLTAVTLIMGAELSHILANRYQ